MSHLVRRRGRYPDSDSAGTGCGLRFCTADKLPAKEAAAGLGPHFERQGARGPVHPGTPSDSPGDGAISAFPLRSAFGIQVISEPALGNLADPPQGTP